jgi:hypothetical protein
LQILGHDLLKFEEDKLVLDKVMIEIQEKKKPGKKNIHIAWKYIQKINIII